jgi:mono/diheme cytochrome c family protein
VDKGFLKIKPEKQRMNQLSRVAGIAVLAVGGALALFLVSGTQGSSMASPAPQAAQAQDVYLDKCAVCHAKDGSGNTAKGKKVKAKDLRSAEVQKMTDAQLIDAVANGKGKDMDGFQKELGADTVKQLVAYCRSLAKP